MGLKDFNFQAEITRLNRSSRTILTLALIGLFFVSLACLWEDYSTSIHGLLLVPGQLVNDWLRFALAATPSLLQIVFAFVALTQGNRIAAVITLAAWTFDFGTDLAYKFQGVEATPLNILVVVLYSLFIVSFFSEFMLIFTAQHLLYALEPLLLNWRERWADARQEAERERQNREAQKARPQGDNASLADELRGMVFADDPVGPGSIPSGDRYLKHKGGSYEDYRSRSA